MHTHLHTHTHTQIEWKLRRPEFNKHSSFVSNFTTNKLYQILKIGEQTTDKIILNPNGTITAETVGIGTTSPSEKLEVNGYVKATGFKTPTGTSTQFLMADGSVSSKSFVEAIYQTDTPVSKTGNWTSMTTSSGITGWTHVMNLDWEKNDTGKRWSAQIAVNTELNSGMYYRSSNGVENITNKSWKQLYDDSIWNAASLSYSGSTLTLTINGISKTATINAGTTYNLPIASASVLGGVKIGSGISIDGNGVISVSNGIAGTVNYIPKFTASGAIGNSLIYDNGTNVGIGTTSPFGLLTLKQGAAQIDISTTSDSIIFEAIDRATLSNPVDIRSYARNGNHIWYNSSYLERMRIDASGNVGIGTTSPSARLDVNGNMIVGAGNKSIDGWPFYISDSSNLGWKVSDSSGTAKFELYVGNSGINQMRLLGGVSIVGHYQDLSLGTSAYLNMLNISNTNGNVGIGTTSPSEKLTVSGTIENPIDNSAIIIGNDRNLGFVKKSGYQAQITTNSSQPIIFSKLSTSTITSANVASGTLTELVRITNSGDVGIGTGTPTQKLEVSGNVKATSFIKSGGTSTQFLMADGSTNNNTYSVTTHTHTFASLTSKPTTLAGYGITDSVNSSEYKNFGEIQFGTGADWTTTDFINHLTSIGFFNQPHSIARGSWNYAGNSNIVDAFGGIELAGTIVESFSNATHKTIRITCPTTSTTTSAGRVFIYNDQQNGTYSPGWREEITTNSPSVSNWNTAYGWGNHATQGYLTSATLPAPLTSFSTSAWAGTGGYPGYSFAGGNSRFGFSSSGGTVDVYADGNFYATDNLYRVWHAGDFSSTNISNWDTAYGWGNHASAGYLKSSDLSNYVTTGTTQTITGAKTFNSVINFSNNVGGIQGNIGDNDYWRVIGSNTASNAGYLEIATADDGNEPIYVRQYTGVFSSLTRTAVLLDGAGNTSFPGTITAPIFSGTSAIFSGDINAPRIRLRDDSIEHIGAGNDLNIAYSSGNGNRNNTVIYDGQYNIITAFNGTTHEAAFYGDITSRGKAFINLSGNHGLSPSISLAIGDNDTGFNWEGDGSISYYSNSAKRFDLNNVWHSGNDGAGSGLDADLLDGNHASAFQLALTNPVTGTGADNRIAVWSGTTTQDSDSNLTWNGTTFNVGGTLTATVKSFIIDHPTKQGKKLQYGVLEGPEHSVYFRGKLTNSRIITLPDHWHALVHEDTITVNLTPIGKKQDLWVETVSDTTITVGSDNEINCFYTVFAERKDIEKLVTEFDK